MRALVASIVDATATIHGATASIGNAMSDACPVCALRWGFHDHDVHAQRVTIPADKLITKGAT